jgi:hypothetical protein
MLEREVDEEARFDDSLEAPTVTREELFASMPPEVRRAFPRFNWTENALWRLNPPVEELPVQTFTWLLDLPIRRWQGQCFQLSMGVVLNDPATYRAHREKAER